MSMSSHSWVSSAVGKAGKLPPNRSSSSTRAIPATSHSALPWCGNSVAVWMKRPSLVANKTPNLLAEVAERLSAFAASPRLAINCTIVETK